MEKERASPSDETRLPRGKVEARRLPHLTAYMGIARGDGRGAATCSGSKPRALGFANGREALWPPSTVLHR